MKRKISIFILVCSTLLANAATYSIKIVGTMYSPDILNVKIGDTVNIDASTIHPLVQVDRATWYASDNTPMSTGWGTTTSSYNFHATTADTIYFVCSAHVKLGMKGRIVVQSATGITNASSLKSMVTLYPNPISTQGILSISTQQGSEISASIFALNGQMVKQVISKRVNTTGEYRVSFDVTDLSNGEYFMLVNENEKKYTSKFVVIK